MRKTIKAEMKKENDAKANIKTSTSLLPESEGMDIKIGSRVEKSGDAGEGGFLIREAKPKLKVKKGFFNSGKTLYPEEGSICLK